jgi:hypothetical protein
MQVKDDFIDLAQTTVGRFLENNGLTEVARNRSVGFMYLLKPISVMELVASSTIVAV